MAGHMCLSRVGRRLGIGMHIAQPCRGAPLWAPRLMYQGSGLLMLYWSCMASRDMSLYSHEDYCCFFK